jgi:transposase
MEEPDRTLVPGSHGEVHPPRFRHEPGSIDGRKFFDHWYNWAIRSRLQPMRKVARMLNNGLDQILTSVRHHITISTAAGFNCRIQSLKSSDRRFRSLQNYRTRILIFCGKFNLTPCLNCD